MFPHTSGSHERSTQTPCAEGYSCVHKRRKIEKADVEGVATSSLKPITKGEETIIPQTISTGNAPRTSEEHGSNGEYYEPLDSNSKPPPFSDSDKEILLCFLSCFRDEPKCISPAFDGRLVYSRDISSKFAMLNFVIANVFEAIIKVDLVVQGKYYPKDRKRRKEGLTDYKEIVSNMYITNGEWDRTTGWPKFERPNSDQSFFLMDLKGARITQHISTANLKLSFPINTRRNGEDTGTGKVKTQLHLDKSEPFHIYAILYFTENEFVKVDLGQIFIQTKPHNPEAWRIMRSELEMKHGQLASEFKKF